MAKLYGRGLVVYSDRWSRENGFLWRFFPGLRVRAHYAFRNLIRKPKIDKLINTFQLQSPPPLFSRIELETQNRCNGTCAFCPVNRNAPQRPYARMSEALYSRILDQLSSMKYRNAFSLYSNNEPLLDPRMPEFAAQAKARLPKAHIKMFTNGSVLTLDTFRTLLPNLDRLFINNYNTQPAMHPNIQEIHDFCLTGEGKNLLRDRTVVIQLRRIDAVLSSRGGNAPNRLPPKRAPFFNCSYPFLQFIIRPDGRISLCCNDALGQMTLGDLNSESMVDIWRGEKYTHIRKTMAEKGRAGIPLCSRCDFLA